MKVIDLTLLDKVSLEAKESPRLRMNYNFSKNVWHKLESLESGSVIFECKEGPFVPHDAEGISKV